MVIDRVVHGGLTQEGRAGFILSLSVKKIEYLLNFIAYVQHNLMITHNLYKKPILKQLNTHYVSFPGSGGGLDISLGSLLCFRTP